MLGISPFSWTPCEVTSDASVQAAVPVATTGELVETKIFDDAPSFVVQFTVADVDEMPESAIAEMVGAVVSTTGVVEVP